MNTNQVRTSASKIINPEEFRTHEDAVSKAWLVTFSDLISLMLTFFVLLFSMSSVQIGNWDMVTDALSRTLNPTQEEKEPILQSSEFNISTVIHESGTNLDYLTSVMEELLSKDAVLGESRLMRLDDRLVIALPSDVLFEPGRAVMSEHALNSVFLLSGALRNINNRIGINGHSDPAPSKTALYTSNWELSIARAVAVSNMLRRSGVRQDIAAYGFSDSRYDELPTLPASQRDNLARRVDIVIFPTTGAP